MTLKFPADMTLTSFRVGDFFPRENMMVTTLGIFSVTWRHDGERFSFAVSGRTDQPALQPQGDREKKIFE